MTLTVPTDACSHKMCDGSGIILVRDLETGNEFAKFCACRDKLITKSKIKFAEIPEEFRDLKISSFKTNCYENDISKTRAVLAKKAATNFVKEFEVMKRNGKGLYLYGYTKGSGKTRLAVSIANALMNVHKVSVKFTTTPNLLEEIKAAFRSDSEYTSSELINVIKRIPVLVLDDIGTEKPSSWVNETFYSILNDRMTGNKVTIFTSNCTIEELLHDDRIKNRIEKMAVPICFPEESMRTKIAKKENEDLQMILFK